MKKRIFIILAIFITIFLFSQSIQISQIDNSSLLFNQRVKLFLSTVDGSGNPVTNLSKEQVAIYESADNKDYKKIDKIYYFGKRDSSRESINFLLLIDNSGSMYQDINGKNIDKPDDMRIGFAKAAAIDFIKGIGEKDRIAIVSYNSYYTVHTDFTSDKNIAIKAIEEIKRPVGDEAWTEIYASLYKAIDEFKSKTERNAIVILSDGENMPYFQYTKKAHREYGEKIFKYSEPILSAQHAGVSIFAVNFGDQGEKRDKNLSAISVETGGRVFDAYNAKDLIDIYKKIAEQIQNEYAVIYRATMDPTDKKFVKIDLNLSDKVISTTRFYFSSPLFGLPIKFNPWFLIVFPLAILVLFLLSLFKFKNKNKDATLEVLNTHYGRAMTKVLTLNKGATIIGSSTNANMTIVGSPAINEKHAKIDYDKNSGKYTLIADGETKVNNQKVKTKILEDGDVITIGGATIVFDKGMMDKEKEKK